MIRLFFGFFLLFAHCAFAANLTVSTAKHESAGRYAVLTIDDERAFSCERQKDGDNYTNDYLCRFNASAKINIEQTQNDFFRIQPLQERGRFALKITAKMRSKLFSQNLNPKSEESGQYGVRPSMRFILVAYEKTMPFINEKTPKGLNFPVSINTDAFAYVKTLDINGLPISDDRSMADMKAYGSIQKLLAAGQYKQALSEIDKVRQAYPNSIFTSEYEFFKMKALSGLDNSGDYGKVTLIGKEWIKNHASDEQMPNVLLMMAVAHGKVQDFANAAGYFNRVIEDYEDQDISKQAMIAFADAIRPTRAQDSIPLYRRALFETKNIETASIAAFKLADLYLQLGDTRNATQYYSKIVKGNIGFVLKDREKAFEFAKKLGNAKIFSQAYEVGVALLPSMKKEDPNYETLLSLVGQWAHGMLDIPSAKRYYERYLKEFPNGHDKNTIQTKLDGINFGEDSGTVEQRLKMYDEIASKYAGDIASQQAIYKKALLLFEQKRFEQIVGMREKLSAVPKGVGARKEEILQESIKRVAYDALAKNSCKTALGMIESDRLAVPVELDVRLYGCYENASRYTAAKEVATRHAQERDLSTRAEWLQRTANMSFKLGEYKNAAAAARDLLKLGRLLKTDRYDKIAYELFESGAQLGDMGTMNEALGVIESKFAKRAETIEPYKMMVRIALKKEDALLTLNYAKKLYELQQNIKAFPESPWINFVYAEALNRGKDGKKALSVAQQLLSHKLSGNDRARAMYLVATLQQNQGGKAQAKKILTECSQIKEDSSWKKLCIESLQLLR